MKKIWVNILIFFGCFLLLVTTLGAVLIIAPGMELLGVMYIRSTSGTVEAQKSVPNATNYKTIEIESNNIPVVIEFVQSYYVTVKFVERYNGFAKAGEEPSVEVNTSEETLKIKSHEYIPFLGLASRSDDSALYVRVPMYYLNDLVVNSNNSAVKFGGQSVILNNVTVNANGKIIFGNSMKMNSLTLNFGNKNVEISESVNLYGIINATSKRGSLTVPSGFTGSLNFKSTTGNLYLAECGQLNFTSTIGQIKGNDGQLPVINGDAKISTKGSVEIERINGAAVINTNNAKLTLGKAGDTYENRLDIYTKYGDIIMKGKYKNIETVISSKYGDVSIDEIENGVIETKSGDIKINKLNLTQVSSESGDINIDTIDSSIVISTTRGDISINHAYNVEATTTSGDVTILEALGDEYNITTKNGDIKFTNAKDVMSKLTIYSKKGNVEVIGACGETSITTNGKVNASFKSVTKPVSIKCGNKAVTVTLDKACYYNLSSKRNIESAPGLSEKTKSYNNLPNDKLQNVLKIETNRGKINVTLN